MKRFSKKNLSDGDDSDNDSVERNDSRPMHAPQSSTGTAVSTAKIYGRLRGPAPEGVVVENMDSLQQQRPRRAVSTDLSLIAASETASTTNFSHMDSAVSTTMNTRPTTPASLPIRKSSGANNNVRPSKVARWDSAKKSPLNETYEKTSEYMRSSVESVAISPTPPTRSRSPPYPTASAQEFALKSNALANKTSNSNWLGEKPPVRSISPALISIPPVRKLTPESQNEEVTPEFLEQKLPIRGSSPHLGFAPPTRKPTPHADLPRVIRDESSEKDDIQSTTSSRQQRIFIEDYRYSDDISTDIQNPLSNRQHGGVLRMLDSKDKRMSSLTLLSPEHRAKASVTERLQHLFKEVRMPDCIEVEVQEDNIAYVVEDAATTTTSSSSSQSVTLASRAMITIPELEISSIPAPNLRQKLVAAKQQNDYDAKEARILEIVENSLGMKAEGQSSRSAYGIEQARQEALKYAMYGGLIHQPPEEMDSVATEEESSKQTSDGSSSNPSSEGSTPQPFGKDKRRISSLTFISHRAPAAPGEATTITSAAQALFSAKPLSEKSSQRVKFDTAKNEKSERTRKHNNGYTSQNSEKGHLTKEARMPKCIEVQMDGGNVAYAETQPDSDEAVSYATRTGSTVRVIPTPSMVTILESEASSVPPPPTSMLERQREVSVPGAWRIPGRIFRSIVSQQRSRAREDDSVSQASRSTVRSYISAKWSLILPTRRLESVQPIAVKPARSQRSCWAFSTLGVCGVVVIVVIIVTVLVVTRDDPTATTASTSPATLTTAFNASDAPTFSPADDDGVRRTPNPVLPDKPVTTIPPRSAGPGSNNGIRGRQASHDESGEGSDQREAFWSL